MRTDSKDAQKEAADETLLRTEDRRCRYGGDMSTTLTPLRGGVAVPDTPVIDRAMDYARDHCEPYIFNHAMRSWLFAVRIGQLRDIAFDAGLSR